MRRVLGSLAVYAALVLAAAITLVPLVWLVACAVKRSEDFFHYVFFPIELPKGASFSWSYLKRVLSETDVRMSLRNFSQLFVEIHFVRFLMNSFFVSGMTVLVQLFFASLGGFALAKYEFRGKRPIMVVMLATMMIPGQVLLAPLYELVYHMGLVDSYFGLIVPACVSVFGMFLFRQSMMQIPDDLLQAGRIDGCSELGLYWNIAMPVSRPMIGAFCLISFMGTWNSFLWPQIILQNQQRFTLPIALNQMVGLYHQEYGVLMAGTLLAITPVVILFFILQKEFISGLTAGAVKG